MVAVAVSAASGSAGAAAGAAANPAIASAAPPPPRAASAAAEVDTDFLIVGCGPAGASLACFLAAYGARRRPPFPSPPPLPHARASSRG